MKRALGILLGVSCALAHGYPEDLRSEDPSTYVLVSQTVGWDSLEAKYFDLGWCLPAARVDGGRDLTRELRSLLAARLDLRLPEALREPGEPELLGSFAALAARVQACPPGERGAWLGALLAANPKVQADWGYALRQLLDDGLLLGEDWEPGDASDSDGIFEVDAWELPKKLKPWSQVGVDLVAEQGAVFLRSDLFSFKEVENDYAVYGKDVDADYESIGPVRGSLVTGQDPSGLPFSSYRVAFRCDLPFPFGGYDCDLRVLNRMTAAGELEAYIYSESSDFHWIAGRDRFLPVRTETGELVGHLLVRAYGFDLDGVPDKRKHRQAALRGSLGNLKRKAEARFSATGLRDLAGQLPAPPLRGLVEL